MAIVVLWADSDHQKRADLLARTYGAQSINFEDTSAAKIDGLDTLVFWGHGDASKFCHLESHEFIDVVTSWVSKNKDISSIEMISCNLRHRQGTHPDSYTTKVVSGLKKKHAKIQFKALPVAITKMSVTCENSILKWHPGTETWAYCAAPGKNDNYMWQMCKILEDRMPPRGTCGGYFRAHNDLMNTSFMETNKVTTGKNNMLQTEPCPRNHILCIANNGFISSGTIGTLRWNLEEIK